MWTRISNLIPLLQRFPQCAELVIIGDRGTDDIRVFAPIDGNFDCENWEYYRIDTPDEELPWL